jgi:para-nitrobenzyl esterase
MAGRRVLLVGCIVLAVAACSGDDDGSPANETDAASTSVATTESTVVGTSEIVTTTPSTAAAGHTSQPATDPTTTTDAAAPADPLLVDTTLGAVRGTTSGVPGVRAFLTIPYAAPPTGDNRWRPPQPHEPWTRPLRATRPGASCPQPTDGVVAQFTVIPPATEDCLTLSVWSPRDAEGIPVMVWFHGGGFSTGSAHQPYYIGDRLAGNGAVVVNVNYRLGALGFLAADLLADEGGPAPGNYGLADQVAALEWVRDNAEGFGGDPGNVTIFGESAGGFSVCGHLASPMSEGLFHKAIIQSGGGCAALQSPAEAAQAGADLLAELGCDDLACLEQVPARRLGNASFNPTLVADGERLITPALDRAAEGALDGIPVLTGSNADEATLFTLGAPEPTDAELLARFGEISDSPQQVAALYPDGEFDTNLAKSQALSTEMAFTCPSLEFAAAAPESYAYHYSYVSPGNPFGLGATHGAELAFVFGHPEGIRGLDTDIDRASRRLSGQIQRLWVDFARTGTPREGWPTYGESGEIIQLDRPVQLVDEIRDGRCDELADLAR